MILRNLPAMIAGDSVTALADWARKLSSALQDLRTVNWTNEALFPGFVTPWPDGATKDSSWYFLDGQLLLKTEDPGLWKVYGDAFNTGGETADEFRLPSVSPPYSDHKWMVKR